MEKTCSKCGTLKPLLQFYKQKKGLFGRTSCCKLCEKERTYAWRKNNPGGHAKAQAAYRNRFPDRAKESFKKWAEVHALEYERTRYKRRQTDKEQYKKYRESQQTAKYRRRAAGKISVGTVRELLKRPCAYCGETATTVDHILPISRGGTNSIENLAPACIDCNRRKGTRTPSEWRRVA